jgi:hypothetical protein
MDRNKFLLGGRLFNTASPRLGAPTQRKARLLWVIQKDLPETIVDEEKEERKEDDIKERKMIIYSVRDHLLPRIAKMKTTYEIYEALKNMFESNNTLKALTLKGQLQNIKMTKGDTIAIFFMNMS